MRRLLLLLVLCLAITPPAIAQEIVGSGSTFAYPVLAKWAEAYDKASSHAIVYHPIGSSAGITEIKSDLVDFAISDAPLVDAQLLRDGLVQFPVTIGGIVPIVNLSGLAPGQLRFTGPLLADIYLGKVKNWNDPAIAAVNPDLKLPNQPILPIFRSDGSGTSFNWADYLSRVSDEWNARVGVSTNLAWPLGAGGKGNGGVADNVVRVSGAIGYVEYAYAVRRKLVYGLVQNRAGHFVPPDAASFAAALAGVEWLRQHDFYALLSDAPGANAYPIMATSFVLMRKYPRNLDHTHDALAFFRWTMEDGQAIASAAHHLPLPPALVHEIEVYWEDQIHPVE